MSMPNPLARRVIPTSLPTGGREAVHCDSNVVTLLAGVQFSRANVAKLPLKRTLLLHMLRTRSPGVFRGPCRQYIDC